MKETNSASKRARGIVTPKNPQKRTRKNGVKFRELEPYENPSYGKMLAEKSQAKRESMLKRIKKQQKDG